MRQNLRIQREDNQRSKTLKEVAIKEKHPRSSFIAFNACNGQYEWLSDSSIIH